MNILSRKTTRNHINFINRQMGNPKIFFRFKLISIKCIQFKKNTFKQFFYES